MKIIITRPFTGTPGGTEKPFAAGQEIAVPGELDAVTAKSYVAKKLAVRMPAQRNKKERPDGH